MSALHIYEGDCPDELDPDARDPSCPACKELLAFEAIARREWDELENGMKNAQFYFRKAIQEQHPELVPVLTGNKKWETVLEKCKELGMVEDYRKGQLDNVLEFIESLAGVSV